MLPEAEPTSIECHGRISIVEHNNAAEPETEPTCTSPTKTLPILGNTTAMLPEAEPTSIACYNDETLPVGHNTLTEPETEPTSTNPDRTPPVPSIAIAIVPHSDPSIIACHAETLPAGHNSTTEPEATKSRPVLVTEANTNPRKSKRNTKKWSKTQKKNTGQQPQKQMREPCKCKLKCFEKIPSDRRLEIFRQFWASGNHETQWQFILKNTEIIEPKVMKIQRKREGNRTFDSMHACIEKNMKNKILYSPDQLYEVIMNSKVQNKFVIKVMTQNYFYNLKSQVTTNKNWSQDTNGHKVLFSKIKEIKTSPDAPNKLLFKYDFESNEYLVLDTTNRTSTRTRKTNNVNAVGFDELPLAYAQLLPISNALFKDLINLCGTNAIPLHYQTFYRNLLPATESPNLEVFDSSEEE